jgi:hypothetical protein
LPWWFRLRWRSLRAVETPVQKGIQELKDRQVRKVRKAFKAYPARKARRVPKVLRARRALLARRETRETRANPVQSMCASLRAAAFHVRAPKCWHRSSARLAVRPMVLSAPPEMQSGFA